MKPYSTDLRQRIIHAINHDKNTPDQTATRFQISRATVYNYLQLDRDLGDLTPLKSTGRKRKITKEQEPLLRQQLTDHPDDTLEMHCHTWKQNTGTQVSFSTMRHSIHRLGISLKKNANRQ